MGSAHRDVNRTPNLLGISSSDGLTPIEVYTDPVTHRLLTDVADSATLAVTVQAAGIAAAGSGDNTLVSAQGVGKVIYVFAWNLSFSGTVNAKFTDGAAGTNLSGLYYGIQNAGGGNAITPPGFLWKTTANTALILNLSGAVAVGGSVSYYVI